MGRVAKLGTSLESTPIGAALNFAGSGVPYIVWKAASATFAANAKGVATKVGSQSGNIWRTIELKILQLRGIPVKYVP